MYLMGAFSDYMYGWSFLGRHGCGVIIFTWTIFMPLVWVITVCPSILVYVSIQMCAEGRKNMGSSSVW